MSLFIHSENQEMLWNMISKTELFSQIFGGGSPQSQTWFRNIIQKIYNQLQSRSITSTDLKFLNRTAISEMIQSLKDQTVKPPPNLSNYLVESKEEKSARQFQERQSDYDNMLKKPVPKQVDFGETVKDEAISNMDELIKEHMKHREEELQLFAPPAKDPISVVNEPIRDPTFAQVLELLTKRVEVLEGIIDTLQKNNVQL